MEAVQVGKLRATFVVGADGSVSEVNVLGTADKALKERIRNMFLVMKGWTAGSTAGKAVAVRIRVKL
jgi:hypothetical protein